MKSHQWALAGFVALSMACSGAAFANHEKGEHNGHHDGGGKWRHGGPGCDMSPEKRELLHGAMKKAHEDNAALQKQMHDRHAAMEKVLGANKFNPDDFLKVYDEIAALHAQEKRGMAAAFAGVAGKLSPEERKKCALFLAGGMHPPGMRGHHGGGHGMHHGGWGHHGERGGSEKFGHRMGNDAPSASGSPAGNDWGKLNN